MPFYPPGPAFDVSAGKGLEGVANIKKVDRIIVAVIRSGRVLAYGPWNVPSNCKQMLYERVALYSGYSRLKTARFQ